MTTRVPARPRSKQSRLPICTFQLSALVLLGDTAGRWAGIATVILVVTIVALVLLPAVWSRKGFRRKAALDVIDRFTGRTE